MTEATSGAGLVAVTLNGSLAAPFTYVAGDVSVTAGPLVSTFATFGEVLKTVVGFLVDNPGETVVMRVKEEFTAMDNTESFEQTFDRAYWAYYKDYFYQHPANSSSDPNNPPLAEMRGKIVLLQNFSNSYGIRYGSDQFDIQDQYNLKSNADLYDKWRAVPRVFEGIIGFVHGAMSFDFLVPTLCVGTHWADALRPRGRGATIHCVPTRSVGTR